MKNYDIMLSGELDQPYIKIIRRTDTYRIQRVRHNHILRLRKRLFRDAVQIRKVAVLFFDLIAADVRLCHNSAHLKHRISRIRHKNHIARITEDHADMRHRLLGAIYGHDLIRLQVYAETFLITVLHRLQKFRKIRQRILIVLCLSAGFLHGFHHMGRRFEIRRSHGQVIHFASLPKQLLLLLI